MKRRSRNIQAREQTLHKQRIPEMTGARKDGLLEGEVAEMTGCLVQLLHGQQIPGTAGWHEEQMAGCAGRPGGQVTGGRGYWGGCAGRRNTAEVRTV